MTSTKPLQAKDKPSLAHPVVFSHVEIDDPAVVRPPNNTPVPRFDEPTAQGKA